MECLLNKKYTNRRINESLIQVFNQGNVHLNLKNDVKSLTVTSLLNMDQLVLHVYMILMANLVHREC